AVQIQFRRLTRPVYPERKPRQEQGSELASSTKRAFQSLDAPVQPQVRCAYRTMEPTVRRARAGRSQSVGAIASFDCTLLAQSAHALVDCTCPLLGVKRT